MYIPFLAVIGIIIGAVVCLAVIYPYFTMVNSSVHLYSVFAGCKIIDHSVYNDFYLKMLTQKKKVAAASLVISIVVVAVGILLKGVLAAGYLAGLFISTAIADSKSRNNPTALENAFCDLIKLTPVNWDLLEQVYQRHKWHPLAGNQTLAAFCDWYGHSEERRLYLLRAQNKNNY